MIFILATTEVHKIPITVLSRCQRYDFRRITVDTIADRLKELTDAEGMAVEDRALRYVAKAGDGSMRDALSLLDLSLIHISSSLRRQAAHRQRGWQAVCFCRGCKTNSLTPLSGPVKLIFRIMNLGDSV